jgi:hypothetical protein
MMTMLRPRFLVPLALAIIPAVSALAGAPPGPGPLFPEPFRVAHHLVQEDGDGSRFVGEPVVDTYGGSWIVSERPDGSRLIVDLARRELSEVRPDKGVYWTVSFDRFGELQKQLRDAQGLAPEPKKEAGKAAVRPAAELVVTEVAADVDADRAASRRSGAAALADRPGVRRLRVTRQDAEKAAGKAAAVPLLDVWVDPSVRLTPAALGAVASLETVFAGPDAADAGAVTPGRSLAAARTQAGGAFPVRTVRLLAAPGAQVEDETTRLERLERFPSELAEIPEGLRRVPHPLEAMVRFLAEDAARNAAMAGRKTGQKP